MSLEGQKHAGTAEGLTGLAPLHIGGYSFDPPIVLAPMAGVSEAPYRVICKKLGAGLAPTELVSAKGLEYKSRRTERYLAHDPADEPCLMVQIYGGEPASMAQAAEIAAGQGAAIVDINMGCPVKKVTKNGAGSALLTEPRRAADIVRAMKARVGERTPITAKIRAGWDEASRNAADVGRALEDAGLSAITLHPRTRAQGYTGKADWSLIAKLKQAVSIPVIANGDVASPSDAARILRETGADAVMIGRAALGNPWIFRELAAAHAGREKPAPVTPEERARLVLAHFRAHVQHIGDELAAVRKFRQHLIWYSAGLAEGSAFRGRVLTIESKAEVEESIEAFFGHAQRAGEEAAIYDERTAFG